MRLGTGKNLRTGSAAWLRFLVLAGSALVSSVALANEAAVDGAGSAASGTVGPEAVLLGFVAEALPSALRPTVVASVEFLSVWLVVGFGVLLVEVAPWLRLPFLASESARPVLNRPIWLLARVAVASLVVVVFARPDSAREALIMGVAWEGVVERLASMKQGGNQ